MPVGKPASPVVAQASRLHLERGHPGRIRGFVVQASRLHAGWKPALQLSLGISFAGEIFDNLAFTRERESGRGREGRA